MWLPESLSVFQPSGKNSLLRHLLFSSEKQCGPVFTHLETGQVINNAWRFSQFFPVQNEFCSAEKASISLMNWQSGTVKICESHHLSLKSSRMQYSALFTFNGRSQTALIVVNVSLCLVERPSLEILQVHEGSSSASRPESGKGLILPTKN